MTAPVPRRTTSFEVVPPPAAPAPTAEPAPAPRRPVGVALLAVAAMASGVAMLLALVAFAGWVTVSPSDFAGTGVSFVLASFATVSLPPAFVAGGLGWGMWRGREWARSIAVAILGMACVLALTGLAIEATDAAPDAPDDAPASVRWAFLGASFGVPLLLVAYLTRPGVRGYFSPAPQPSERASPAQRREHGAGVRVLLTLGVGALLLVGVALTKLPLQSLMSSSDGATLGADAVIGLVAGVVLLGGGLAALVVGLRLHDARPAGPVVAILLGGIVAGLVLVAAAKGAAREPLLDGRATGADGAYAVYHGLALLAFAALGVVVWRAPLPLQALLRWGSATAAALGLAAAFVSLYALADVEALQTAAAARERHYTPSVGVALLLAMAAAAALARRRR